MTPAWKDTMLRVAFGVVGATVFLAAAIVNSPAPKREAKEVPCTGHCPDPGPLDCTIYGRKKDGSWPSGYECSSTP